VIHEQEEWIKIQMQAYLQRRINTVNDLNVITNKMDTLKFSYNKNNNDIIDLLNQMIEKTKELKINKIDSDSLLLSLPEFKYFTDDNHDNLAYHPKYPFDYIGIRPSPFSYLYSNNHNNINKEDDLQEYDNNKNINLKYHSIMINLLSFLYPHQVRSLLTVSKFFTQLIFRLPTHINQIYIVYFSKNKEKDNKLYYREEEIEHEQDYNDKQNLNNPISYNNNQSNYIDTIPFTANIVPLHHPLSKSILPINNKTLEKSIKPPPTFIITDNPTQISKKYIKPNTIIVTAKRTKTLEKPTIATATATSVITPKYRKKKHKCDGFYENCNEHLEKISKKTRDFNLCNDCGREYKICLTHYNNDCEVMYYYSDCKQPYPVMCESCRLSMYWSGKFKKRRKY